MHTHTHKHTRTPAHIRTHHRHQKHPDEHKPSDKRKICLLCNKIIHDAEHTGRMHPMKVETDTFARIRAAAFDRKCLGTAGPSPL